MPGVLRIAGMGHDLDFRGCIEVQIGLEPRPCPHYLAPDGFDRGGGEWKGSLPVARRPRSSVRAIFHRCLNQPRQSETSSPLEATGRTKSPQTCKTSEQVDEHQQAGHDGLAGWGLGAPWRAAHLPIHPQGVQAEKHPVRQQSRQQQNLT